MQYILEFRIVKVGIDSHIAAMGDTVLCGNDQRSLAYCLRDSWDREKVQDTIPFSAMPIRGKVHGSAQ